MTSSTSPASTSARASAALIAAAPSSCAGVAAKAPLKDPTAVRAALTITISPGIGRLLDIDRGMRATRFSAILALAGTACEPRVRPWYRNGCNFSRAELQRFLAAALGLYPYTDANGRVDSRGRNEVCPRQNPWRD